MPVEGPLEAPLCGSTSSPTVVRQAAGSSAAKHQPWFGGLFLFVVVCPAFLFCKLYKFQLA